MIMQLDRSKWQFLKVIKRTKLCFIIQEHSKLFVGTSVGLFSPVILLTPANCLLWNHRNQSLELIVFNQLFGSKGLLTKWKDHQEFTEYCHQNLHQDFGLVTMLRYFSSQILEWNLISNFLHQDMLGPILCRSLTVQRKLVCLF